MKRALALCVLLFACNQRFEYDVPEGGGGGGGGGGGSESAGVGGSTLGAAGTAGSGGGSACGDDPACPFALHCLDSACVECVADDDCVGAEALRCDPERHRCVACLEETDCGPGLTCDELANRCLPICREEVDCPSTAHGCDERRGVCYQCDEDRECASSPLGKLCAADGSGCVACRTDQDCSNQHCDALSGSCVQCRDGADCASGRCDPSAHTCLR